MTTRFSFLLRLSLLLLFSGAAPVRAHHGPPHEEVDEFLQPASRSAKVGSTNQSSLWEFWPALLVPCAVAGGMILLASAGHKETASH